MSEISSGLVKLAYRGIAGFFVLLIMFVFGVTGFSLALAGGLIIAFCWIPLAFPELLEDARLVVFDSASGSVPITDPVVASAILLFVGLILLAVGFLLLAITFVMGKAAIVVDKELSRTVDRTFASSGKIDRISRLERLAALLDRGVITPEEFEREKAMILNQPDAWEPEKVGKGKMIKDY
ncbi:MAG: SHOCT domain-containing protein [Candidatus Heimdallarchaeota archaeon]|nr:MAG: SHOCT domain-containing protein [Candidatus Heimdallarchaeota archaeon]